jgi:rhodanese-related sulfurtransferase
MLLSNSGKEHAMSLMDALRRVMGRDPAPTVPPAASGPPPAPRAAQEPEPEPVVREMGVEELRTAPLLILDIREPYEWRQVRLTDAVHIPMNEIPGALDQLPKQGEIVIMCAHGNRSYAVTAWLCERGYDAVNLRGGIADWARRGWPVDQGAPRDAGA